MYVRICIAIYVCIVLHDYFPLCKFHLQKYRNLIPMNAYNVHTYVCTYIYSSHMYVCYICIDSYILNIVIFYFYVGWLHIRYIAVALFIFGCILLGIV